MRKLLPFVLASLPMLAQAQSQRTVILEHFTQASCPPCASWNPILAPRIAACGAKLVTIKYHTSWPGVDPMNSQNAADVQARVTYYNVSGVPSSALNGTMVTGSAYTGSPANWDTSSVSTIAATPSPYELTLNHRYALHPGNDSIVVTAKVKKTAAVTGTTGRLMVAVIEREVSFTTPPGTNGEKVFPYVMKKLLPTANGTNIPSTLAVGDSMEVTLKWKLANVYDISDLAVSAFIQDNTTKRVDQAAYSAPNPPVVFNLGNLPKAVISGATSTNVFPFTIETQATSPTNFKVYGPTSQVAGTSAKLLDSQGAVVDSLQVTASNGSPATVQLQVNVTNGANLHGSAGIKVRPAYDSLKAFQVSKSVPMFSQANILVVNKDNGGAANLATALTGRGAYAINPSEYALAPAELFSLNNYSKIVFSSGAAYSDLISSSVADSLKTFMDNGGDVAYFGAELSYSAYSGGATYLQPILQDYFGSTFVSDGPGAGGADGTVTLAPVAGDTVSYNCLGATLSSASYDQLDVYGDGVASIMYSNTNNVGGISTHVGSRHTAYFSFPFNAYAPSSTRNRLMSNIIAFFDDNFSITGVDGALNLVPMVVAPNPTTGTATFRNLSAGDEVRLMDMTGRAVAEGKANGSTLTLSLEGRPAGLYLAHHVRKGAVVATVQVSVTR